MELDLNSDVGEGAGLDEQIFPLITSANICCGLHAGGDDETLAALELAKKHVVVVGAHVGHDDREHFGRREMELKEEEVFKLCLYQIGWLMHHAKEVGVEVKYIKPHGGLYHQANRLHEYARPIVNAASMIKLPLLAMSTSLMRGYAHGNVAFINEGFADRRYLPNGALVPRTAANAFIETPAQAVVQTQMLIKKFEIRSLCVHGDNPQAVAFVTQLRTALTEGGYALKAFA